MNNSGIRQLAIRRRLRTSMSPAKPEDFGFELLTEGDTAADFADSLAYCLDYQAKRLLYTVHPDTAALFEEPSTYPAQ